ncbi:sulfotransferase [Novosphingobium sp. ERN07]|nr:sulfotransferase [Novosphingobium sp. ERN07]
MRWIDRFDELHEKARAQAGGIADFGGNDYHEGLRVLLEALDADPPPSPMKARAAEGLIVSALASRIQTEANFRANPGYASREIPRPIVVIGAPRTGTTALHNLLSHDPQLQGIEKWICPAPLPRPPREEWDAHPQYRAVTEQTALMAQVAPEVMIAHGVQADDVDECLLPMAQSFCCNHIPSQIDVPVYDAWFAAADERASFARYKDMLRLVGLHDDRPWLLKNPSHVFGIDALLAVFPDACVVQTHRNPVSSLASLVSLLGNVMLAYTGEDIDRPRRLARETWFWAEALKRTMAAQDRVPDRFVNVMQPDIRRDPLGVVHTIYDHFGITLSPEAEARMRTWATANSDRSDGGHSYPPTEDAGPIRAAFADYMVRFGFE